MGTSIAWILPMDFPKRLIQLRKQNGFTQQQLSDVVKIHVNQIKRYEGGTAQPTLEALVKLAKALHVSLDNLVFNEGDRGPAEDLLFQFEAVSQLSPEEQVIIKEVLESLIIKYQTRRWDSTRSSQSASNQ